VNRSGGRDTATVSASREHAVVISMSAAHITRPLSIA
jgi:hypothetical protein